MSGANINQSGNFNLLSESTQNNNNNDSLVA